MVNQIMPDEQDHPTTEESGGLYCAHCGTFAEEGQTGCARCGEHVYVPNPNLPPPLGYAACRNCSTANESHASFCTVCGQSMDSAVRLSPDGASARDSTDS